MTPGRMRSLFRLVYVLPSLAVQTARVVRHAPTVGEPAVVLGLVFGAFVVSALVGSVVVPNLLRRRGAPVRAAAWRRAALGGLDFPAVWLCLWAAVYVPLGSAGGRLLAGAAVGTVVVVALAWVDRRWWGVGMWDA